VFVLVVAVFLVWFNGPGVRWVGGIVLRKVLAKQNISGDFKIRGTILGGLGLEDVRLTGAGPVLRLSADKVAVSYRPTEIIHGRVRSLRIHSLAAVVDLDALPPSEKEPEPLDIPKLIEKIRKGINTAYQYVDPVEIDIRDLAVELRKGPEAVFAIGPTGLAHAGHAAPFQFSLGTISHVTAEDIPAQKFVIDWSSEHLRILPFDPVPRLSVHDVALETADDEQIPLLHLALGFEKRQLNLKVSGDAKSAVLEFTGEPLAWSQLAKGLRLPPVSDFDAELRRLSLSVDGIHKDLSDWDATFDFAAGNIRWQEWAVESAEVHVEQNTSKASATWKIAALDGTVAGTARTEWPASAPLVEKPVPPKVEGTLNVAGLDKILAALGKHIELPEGDAPFPGRTLAADWSLDLAGNQPTHAVAKLTLAGGGEKPPSPIRLDAAWDKSSGATARLATDAVRLDASLDAKFSAYQAELSLDENAVASLSPWIRAFTAAMPEGLAAAAKWKGRGTIDPPLHEGSLELTRLHAPLPDRAPLDAEASVSYRLGEFPDLALDISRLHAVSDKYTLDLRGKLADRVFELAEFSAMDGKDPLISGTGTLPLPEDPADWKALLSLEKPWKFNLKTETLSLEKINSLIPNPTPEKPVIPAKGTVRATIDLAGSPAHPEIHAEIIGEALEMIGGDTKKSPVPPTTVAIHLDTKDGNLALTGKATPNGWPALALDATVPLDHAKWIDDPSSALDAPIQAHAVVPPLDLNLLGPFPDDVKKLTGAVDVDVSVSGTPNEPHLQGAVALRNLSINLADRRFPAIHKGEVLIRLDDKKIHLATLDAEAAGGTLHGSGTADITDIKNPSFDLQLDAKALPAWRDESVIVRIDSSLKLAGHFADATLSGRIGLVQSIFFRDFELIPIGVPFTGPSKPELPHIDAAKSADDTDGPAIPAPFNDWKLDVALETTDPFLIRGNLIQGVIHAKARIGGTIGKPAPSGEIVIDNFEAELPLSRLKIRGGKVILQPDAPYAPKLDIRGTSTLRPYTINVFVHGSATDPKLTFTSNPPLPQNEILTLLATGSTSSGLEKKGAATGKLVQILLEEARRGRLRGLKFLEPALKVFENVDLQVGENDPYTGRDFNSATLNVTDNWLGSVAIDSDGNSRGVVIFLLRFR
jgi:hypothetical protein